MSTAIPTIEVSGVTKMFGERADVKALDDVNLTIRKGEFVSIVGPSGCGKSTLLYALGGFIAPTTGSLKVRGMEITAPGTDRGIVFQEYALFPWMTVFDNIAYGLVQQGMMPGRYKPIVERYIELIGLAGF
jgi:NitT/TauT family transport system ATP-binding protein